MPDPAQNNWKSPAVTTGVVLAALAVGIYIAPEPPPARSVTLIWDDAPGIPPGTVTEVWSTTNVAHPFTIKTNVAGTNRVTLRADKPAEFFIVRHRTPDGQVSAWNTK